MKFQFATATRIIFGCGSVSELPALCSAFGRRVLVATGSDSRRVRWIVEQLEKEGTCCSLFSVPVEPAVETACEAIEQARAHGAEFVVAIGGGSALDLGKAVSAMLTNPGALEDYLEIVGAGNEIKLRAAPFVAVPTTAGTGSEVTKNAVLAVPAQGRKVSMRSVLMLPQIALVDPELTYTLPPEITAQSGLDALTQLIEPFVSNQANALTDGICREGLQRAARSLVRAFQNGSDKGAREDMCIASLFGGLALANARLGAVHGLAAVLGGMFNIPHGVLCARLLPFVVEANIKALEVIDKSSTALDRFSEISRILCNKCDAAPADGVAFLYELCRRLNIPSLGSLVASEMDFDLVADEALKTSSMKGNPVPLSKEDLISILKKAF